MHDPNKPAEATWSHNLQLQVRFGSQLIHNAVIKRKYLVRELVLARPDILYAQFCRLMPGDQLQQRSAKKMELFWMICAGRWRDVSGLDKISVGHSSPASISA